MRLSPYTNQIRAHFLWSTSLAQLQSRTNLIAYSWNNADLVDLIMSGILGSQDPIFKTPK